MGLTQADIGAALKVTFQQIRKYEIGQNRVAASRIAALSEVLRVPTSYFFEAFTIEDGGIDYAVTLEASLQDENCRELNKAFVKIRRSKVRRHVIHFIEHLADAFDEP